MGNCLSLQSASSSNSYTAGNNQLGLSCHINVSGSNQFCSDLSNTTTSNNTNTSSSLWGSENSQNTTLRIRDQEEFPYGQILDAANLRVFTLAEMKAATNNFRSNTVLGEGGFGKVYKGFIKDRTTTNRGHGLTIAVKKMNPDSFQGVQEWQTEVNFLGRLSHPNLVKLLGFGQEDSELFLVYEFLHRGNLDNHLFGRGANVHPLSWDTRLKVMIEAARGLAFLHSLERKIVYRDIKPSNILLDKTYTTKLSDFGLARYGPSSDQTHVTTRVMGTSGRAAPEYIATGHLYVKSDVYGFGILLLEMLTGKRIHDIMRLISQTRTILDWVKSNLLNRGKMRITMDAKLEGKYPPNIASQVAQLTLKCIQTDHKIRPSMKEVVETLEKIEGGNEKPANNRNHATHSQAKAACSSALVNNTNRTTEHV